MPVILPLSHARHDPDGIIGGSVGGRPYFDRPPRIDAFLRSVHKAGLPVKHVGPGPLEAIAAVHSADYLRFLEMVFDRWRAAPSRAKEVRGPWSAPM